MATLNKKPYEIELGGKKYDIIFNLNILEMICQEYGELKNMTDALTDSSKAVGVLKKVLAIMINQALALARFQGKEKVPEDITEWYVGTCLNIPDIAKYSEHIIDCIIECSPDAKKKVIKNGIIGKFAKWMNRHSQD